MSDIMETPIADLIVDPRCQARERMSGETAEEYADLYRAEETLPPLEVFDVDGALVVVDGFHRLEAAFRAAGSLAGVATLPVRVVGHGPMKDAVWYALGTNRKHGLRRTRADKRKAVTMALELDGDRGDREIARQVGVSHTMVSNMRRGEQLRIAEAAADPEELRQEADAEFEGDNFARAALLYEKAIAASPVEARAELKERVRLCEERQAPLKREARILSRLAVERGSEWCAVCGVEVDHCAIVILLSWTEIALCPACLDDQQEKRILHSDTREVAEAAE
jgi:hypothetical protein